MTGAALVLALSELGLKLQANGFITAAAPFEFVDAKFDDIASDAQLAADVEAILKKYGVHTPDKIDKVIHVLPLLAGLLA